MVTTLQSIGVLLSICNIIKEPSQNRMSGSNGTGITSVTNNMVTSEVNYVTIHKYEYCA